MTKILVTGGCGYIGSHTIADLIDNGFDVICADNLSHSTEAPLQGIEQITGKKVKNYAVNLCDLKATQKIFEENPDIQGIIHFAALKSVPESVDKPLAYFDNNLGSLINILRCVEEYKVPYFVFSSSCSVYGNAQQLPVTENTSMATPESPYARSKQIGEQIIGDFVKAQPQAKTILLRYFNPVGAHDSALIGEYATDRPENLVPIITQTAIGKRAKLSVYGDDYDTRDGTCIRDYIHVMDIANAHTKALQYLMAAKGQDNPAVFNLGTGNGVSVLEAINAFEKVSGVALNYEMGPRRPGDVVAIYADNAKAKAELGWNPARHIDDMMLTAWKWEQYLAGQA